jgi:cell wall-associated NlpC family hydrolase
MAKTDPRRAAVVAEAETWLQTPYHHMGRKKGAGTDCLMLLAEVYEAAGVIPHIDVPFYPPDWNLHRDAERYLEGVMQHAREFTLQVRDFPIALATKPMPEPGDVAVFKFGRCYAHGVIVTNWPLLIHSWVDGGVGVLRGDATQPPLAGRPVRFFDPFFESKVD